MQNIARNIIIKIGSDICAYDKQIIGYNLKDERLNVLASLSNACKYVRLERDSDIIVIFATT